jgi:Uma2 family endonuclease
MANIPAPAPFPAAGGSTRCPAGPGVGARRYARVMRGVMLEVPSHLLEVRARTGADRFDEMWEGELHMVPPPDEEHQRIEWELSAALRGPAAEAGLLGRCEIGLFDPVVAEPTSYRQPNLALFTEAVRSRRGIEGAAALVIEIASPGDESEAKLAFYERVGVAEVVIVDRDTKAVRRWRREGGGDALVEDPPAPDGRVALDAVAVTFRQVGEQLEVTSAAGVDVV